jgi:hypothetical protein
VYRRMNSTDTSESAATAAMRTSAGSTPSTRIAAGIDMMPAPTKLVATLNTAPETDAPPPWPPDNYGSSGSSIPPSAARFPVFAGSVIVAVSRGISGVSDGGRTTELKNSPRRVFNRQMTLLSFRGEEIRGKFVTGRGCTMLIPQGRCTTRWHA